MTDAKRRANDKHLATHYEQISFRVRKGVRQEWHYLARARGLSLAGMIVKAVSEYVQNHLEDDPT